MRASNPWFRRPTPEDLPKPRTDFIIVTESTKFAVLVFIALWTLSAAFFFDSPAGILQGLIAIQRSPSILLTDYLAVAGIGAALANGSLVMLTALAVCRRVGLSLSGPVIAALFLMLGFSFFGKNLYNIWPIMLGVLIFSRFQRESFQTVILPALFGTALGPVVSQVSFGLGLAQPVAIPLGILLGLIVGFLLPPLSSHFIRFHQGYNLYNTGFTTGLIGMLFMAIFRGLGYENTPAALLLDPAPAGLTIYLISLLLILGSIGLVYSRRPVRSLWDLWHMPGQLVSDFVSIDGFGIVLVNMAMIGFVSLGYVRLVGAELNGPILGGIFSVVGFGAFGKHLRNILPVMVGVLLANGLFIWEASATSSVLAALFGTALAPIAGAYGILPGIAAGVLHMAVVMNVGYLHGGMNLYNNGLSAGFVAAILVPLLDSVHFSLTSREES